MARKPRIHAPNAYYHVIQRGVERRDVFVDDRDYERFLRTLGDAAREDDWRVHAYCLMSNHVHLVVQAGVEPIAKAMQRLFFRYAGAFNRRHQRSGHLFQGRYKAVLVASDPYIQELVRYVHLNPVRAGVERIPERFRYSSHRYYIGGDEPDWLTTRSVLGMFGSRLSTARRRFGQFVEEGIGKEVVLDFKSASSKKHDLLVPEGYETEVLRRSNEKLAEKVDLGAVIKAVERAYGMELDELGREGRHRQRSEARGMVALVARERTDATLSELARLFGRDTGTLSRSADRVRRAIAERPDVQRRYQQIQAQCRNAVKHT